VAIRVFHADDSEPFRRLIGELLPDGTTIEMAGSAGSPDEAAAGVAREQPDVVLLDQIDGPELVDRLRGLAPGVRVIVLSGFQPGDGDRELEACADAYLVKGADIEALREAVRGA
jgi:DNA-binding NarL/FixJ family response regulator